MLSILKILSLVNAANINAIVENTANTSYIEFFSTDFFLAHWKKPVNNKIHTSIFGVGTVNIEQAVDKTMKHLAL